jgi:hypothetical protein
MERKPANTRLKRLSYASLTGLLYLCALAAHGTTPAPDDDATFQVVSRPPPAFADMSAPQVTEADIYYGGVYLTSAFVKYDPLNVEIIDPVPLVGAIPNVRNPTALAAHLRGPRPTNSARICTSRMREGCGSLQPEVADIIFDESNFRLDLFISPEELLIHRIELERYLPPASDQPSSLHNVRFSLSGTGSDHQYNLSSESFVARGESRVRARYGVSDEGAALHELSWQKDGQDHEYEVGSFRTIGRNVAFTSDIDVLGVRLATSTKRRKDLDQATSTPLFLFLPERSRVDVFRNGELLDSRYYEAGNQQLDTGSFPDGAYDVELRITGHSGAEQTETQFFVRSQLMPPKGEPQFFLEAGGAMNSFDNSTPELDGGAWLHAGYSTRVRDDIAVDSEYIYSNGTSILQSGAYVLRPRWNVYSGVMWSTEGDVGLALRGGLSHEKFMAYFDLRKVSVAGDPVPYDEFALLRESYTQGSATLSMPLGKSRLLLQARINQRQHTDETSLGFSYFGSLYRHRTLSVDFTLDGNYGEARSWIQAGVQIRWHRGQDSISMRPRVQYRQADQDPARTQGMMDAYWNSRANLGGLGELQQSLYVSHDDSRSNIGARFMPMDFPLTDAEIGYQRTDYRTDAYYAMNSQFSVANTEGRTNFGDQGNQAGAILVHVNGNVEGQFEVLVDNRVMGKVSANRPRIISLRPYETYAVRVRPLGDQIIGFDTSSHSVTLYPGNVQALTFNANRLTVLVGRAVHADGSPVARARFDNVEGYGGTDERGWFQVEFAHSEPLVLKPGAEAPACRLKPPLSQTDEDLVVAGNLLCQPIPAPQ